MAAVLTVRAATDAMVATVIANALSAKIAVPAKRARKETQVFKVAYSSPGSAHRHARLEHPASARLRLLRRRADDGAIVNRRGKTGLGKPRRQ